MAKIIGRVRIAYYICIPLKKDFIESFSQRPVRLGVRTQDFHSCNTGSIPVRATKQKSGCFYQTVAFFIKNQISLPGNFPFSSSHNMGLCNLSARSPCTYFFRQVSYFLDFDLSGKIFR